MSFSWGVLATLIVYQVVLLGIGLWYRKAARSKDGFFLGDRSLGPWVAALSYAAGSSSAWSILGVSGIAFSQGLSSFWLLPGTLTGHIIVWFWIAPWLQKRSHERQWLTLSDVITDGLDQPKAILTYRLCAFVILFSFTFYVAAHFQGAANTFAAVFDFDFTTALLLGVAIVVMYTLFGGFWAVSLTDAIQAGLMLFAAILLPLLAYQAVGGLSGIVEFHSQQSSQNYWSLLGGESGWFAVGLMLGMASIGFGPLGQPHLLNRIMALGNGQQIRRARDIALGWFVIVLGGMYLLGICAHVYLNGVSGDAEQVFFVMAENLLPVAATGVLIAAVLSAIMSTADSQLLVAGSALAHDLKTDKKLAGVRAATSARLAVLGVAVAAMLLALGLPESIFSRVLFAWNALGAAFGPVIVCRVLGWQVKGGAVPLAISLGFGLTVVFYSLPNGPGDLWERAIPFVTAFVTLWLGRTSR
ncbi:MAG: sodium/proline symporter [Pseudomonadota bacterium]